MVKLFLATYGPANMAYGLWVCFSHDHSQRRSMERVMNLKKRVDMKLILYALLTKRHCGNEYEFKSILERKANERHIWAAYLLATNKKVYYHKLLLPFSEPPHHHPPTPPSASHPFFAFFLILTALLLHYCEEIW